MLLIYKILYQSKKKYNQPKIETRSKTSDSERRIGIASIDR